MRFRKPDKKTIIEHSGKVVKITPEKIEVNIVSLSACSACHAKAFCSVFDQKEKNIIVQNDGQNVKIGDTVNVQMRQTLGMQAVLFAYVIPVIILIAFLLMFISFSIHEAVTALLSLGILAIYYLTLYLLRDKFKKVYNFHIVKTE